VPAYKKVPDLVSKVTVDLYSASSQTRLRRATASLKSALISASQSVQPGTRTTLRDHGYGLVFRTMCLFTLPANAGYSFQPATEDRLRLSRHAIERNPIRTKP